jgi:diguanylate cyclase (GGDEF)-like protein
MARAGSDAAAGPSVWIRFRSWGLWAEPPVALAAILLIEAIAACGMCLALSSESIASETIGRFALICGMAIAFEEIIHTSERVRRFFLGSGTLIGSDSVWTIAALVALPAGWAVLAVATMYTHTLIRVWRDGSTHPHRLILSGATVMIATLVASATLSSLTSALSQLPGGPAHLVAVVVAVSVAHLANFALVLGVVYLAKHQRSQHVNLFNREEVIFEYVCQILGIIAGELVLHSPWFTPGAIAVLAMLYRGTMVGQLQVQSTVDAKTGLLNFTAWREVAHRALLRAGRTKQPVAVLLIDLDHFKRVNDTYGHLVGDQVLSAVAYCVKNDLREYDMVGRFGGEEFVLLLDNADLYAAVAAATRLRESISELVIGEDIHVTASIGVAHSAHANATLDALLERADVALYEAKSAGRNTVRALAAFSDPPVAAVA